MVKCTEKHSTNAYIDIGSERKKMHFHKRSGIIFVKTSQPTGRLKDVVLECITFSAVQGKTLLYTSEPKTTFLKRLLYSASETSVP